MTYPKTYWLVLTLLVALLGLTACAEESAETTAQEAEVEVAEARSALESSLERAEARLEDLEEAYEEAKGQAREDLRQTLVELRRERAELATAVRELRYETAATFEAAQDDLRARINDLEEAIAESIN